MNITRTVQKWAAIILACLLLTCLLSLMHGQTYAAGEIPYLDGEISCFSPTDEKLYGVDYFPSEYASGYLTISNRYVSPNGGWLIASSENYDQVLAYLQAHGLTSTADKRAATFVSGNYAVNSNHAKNLNVYVDHYDGARLNGISYDVREYTWCDPSTYVYCITSNGNGHRSLAASSAKETTCVYREFHFYPSGTLAQGLTYEQLAACEVPFSGVTRLNDMDNAEGYHFSAASYEVYLNPVTHICKDDRGGGSIQGWFGTWTTNSVFDNSGEEFTNRTTMWVTFTSTPENPFTIGYHVTGYYGGNVNYQGFAVDYHLVQTDSRIPDETYVSTIEYSAKYSSYPVIPMERLVEAEHYTNDGWYLDPELQSEAPETLQIASDVTLYGTLHKTAGWVRTTVINGTITPSMETVDYGTEVTVCYQPAEGYLLNRVTVRKYADDGMVTEENQVLSEASSEFNFTMDADYEIEVEYLCPTSGKAVDFYAGGIYSQYAAAEGKAILEPGMSGENQLLRVGDLIVYTLALMNPTSVDRSFSMVDNLPENLIYRGQATFSEGICDYTGNFPEEGSGGQIEIVGKIKAGSYGYITFLAEIVSDTPESAENVLDVYLEKLEGSNEEQIHMKSSVAFSVEAIPFRSLKIIKELSVSEINFANGTPSFVFQIKGTDSRGIKHTYYRAVEFTEEYVTANARDGKIRAEIVMDKLYAGKYRVSEEANARFKVKEICEPVSGSIEGNTVLFDLSTEREGSAVFVNNKTVYEYFSHETMVINNVWDE